MLKGFKAASDVTGVSVSTLKNWQQAGRFPDGMITKITRRTIYFNEQMLRAWLSGELQTPPAKRPVGRPRKGRG